MSTNHATAQITLEDYAKWKKPVIKGHMLYDSIYMKCPEQTNPQIKVMLCRGGAYAVLGMTDYNGHGASCGGGGRWKYSGIREQ